MAARILTLILALLVPAARTASFTCVITCSVPAPTLNATLLSACVRLQGHASDGKMPFNCTLPMTGNCSACNTTCAAISAEATSGCVSSIGACEDPTTLPTVSDFPTVTAANASTLDPSTAASVTTHGATAAPPHHRDQPAPHVAAIVLGVLAAVLCVAAIGGAISYRRRRVAPKPTRYLHVAGDDDAELLNPELEDDLTEQWHHMSDVVGARDDEIHGAL
eukprot:m.220029 g.220029  ORF g.220029 m.220029 type:complete len:221 (-) comp10297_c0_seq1:1568-2230(-)